MPVKPKPQKAKPLKGSKLAAPKVVVTAEATPSKDPKPATPKAATADAAKSSPSTPTKKKMKTEPGSTPSASVIDSATGGKRFVIDDSDSDAKDRDLLAELATLKRKKSNCDEQLAQAQEKVVLLAASLHKTFNILSSYRERMADWTGILQV